MQGSILNYRIPSLWPNYIGERRPTFAKAYGRKMRCYWELFGEHVKNLGANFDLTPSPKKLAWKVNCPSSKWKVNNGQSILHTKHNLTTNPHPNKQKRGPPSFHDMTSQCLYGN
jgi:hypothetical protein